jgi:hypothetical protein
MVPDKAIHATSGSVAASGARLSGPGISQIRALPTWGEDTLIKPKL